ncbi:putative F-box/FBD/LRR-repeat protein At5g44950 [Papaver somniferum]|uniref:putative F-box/FBD/LRR-repeat protein At5g44950 n=1 Tax=Papaver somniferum TaxID=3469 RepID=UPI000E6FCAF8|nr:putative F-box/FBD/LRR-repeat protein At5g44950 [Papaver somniferum]
MEIDDRIGFGESNTLEQIQTMSVQCSTVLLKKDDRRFECMANSKLQRSSSEGSKLTMKKGNKDRISELPDALIHHILLSFLNIEHVVQMPRRWRYLWVSLPTLRISDYYMDWNVEDPFEALHSSSDIQTLELRWENVGNFKSDLGFKYDVSRHVATWIMAAVKQQDLNLTLFLREMIKFPDCLFTCKSLTKLSVHGFGRDLTSFGLPDVAVYNFPRLRYLQLKGVSLVDENLTIFKHLQPDNCESIDEYDITVKLSAPNLTSLVCKDFMSQDYSLENLSSLVTADIGATVIDGKKHRKLFQRLLQMLKSCTVLE